MSDEKSYKKSKKNPPQKYDPNWKKNHPQQQVYTKQERKELRVKRRDAKPHAQLVHKAKTALWSESLSNMKAAEKAIKVDEILGHLEGKIETVALKRDVSRAIQCCLKHGTKTQRARVLAEIKPQIVKFATNRYAHHLVLKLIQLGDKETQKLIRQQFIGKVVKLSLRADSAKVIDLMFASGDEEVKRGILGEFYSKDNIIRLQTNEPIPTITEQLNGSIEGKEALLAQMEDWIVKFVEKEMLPFRFVHSMILQFWEHGSKASKDKIIPDLCANVMALHHSEDGAKVLCDLFAQGTPKIRKMLLKDIKGKVVELLNHRWGHLVILRALMVTDDTVLLTKGILNELVDAEGGIREDVLSNPNGVRMLQTIFAAGDAKYTRNSEQKLFAQATRTQTDEEGNTVTVATSRKPAEVRRTELLKFLLPKLFISFLADVDEEIDPNAMDTSEDTPTPSGRPSLLSRMKSKLFGKVLYETCIHSSVEQRGPLLGAMASLAAVPKVLEDISAHILLKRLLLNLQPDASDLVQPLLLSLSPDLPQHASSNRGGFVLLALMKAGGSKPTKKILKALKPHAAQIEALGSAGTRLLAQAINTGVLPEGNRNDSKTAPGSRKRKGREETKEIVDKPIVKKSKKSKKEKLTVTEEVAEAEEAVLPALSPAGQTRSKRRHKSRKLKGKAN